MMPICKSHPDKKALCYCQACGFMCDPAEDKHNHPFIIITSNMLEITSLLGKAKDIETALKLQGAGKATESIAYKQDKQKLDEVRAQIADKMGACSSDETIAIHGFTEIHSLAVNF